MAVFQPVFQALNAADVRYVVAGGVAVVLHGHARLTADLDLILDLEPAAAGRAIDALIAAGFVAQLPVEPRDFADPAIRESWIRDKGMRVFSFWHAENPMTVVDLFVEHPIPFEALWARSVEVDLGEVRTRIASIEDLIRLKEQAGRPQDLSDIERLRAIQRRKGRS